MLSYLHIILGSSLIVFFIILCTFSFDTRHSLTCEEIYCGFIFVAIGLFGLHTMKNINLTSLTSFMILNIFGCLFASIVVILSCVRIFMIDRVHENYIMMKQEDLLLLPKLNCTKDVLESLHTQNYPKIFGKVSSTPTPMEIKFNIEQCELMKLEGINDANEFLSSGSGI